VTSPIAAIEGKKRRALQCEWFQTHIALLLQQSFCFRRRQSISGRGPMPQLPPSITATN